jgi:hypothetical protein
MRTKHTAVALLAFATLTVMIANGRGQGPKNGGALDRLATLKVGQWVHIEGAARADSAGRCDELRILTGDFLDDDWALKGLVGGLKAAKRELTVAGLSVRVTEDTRFDSPTRTFRQFSDMRNGQLVEVEGTYRSGMLLAKEVDDETDEIARHPWARSQIMIVGRIERVDSRKRLLWAMGMVFEVTEKTRLRSAIE